MTKLALDTVHRTLRHQVVTILEVLITTLVLGENFKLLHSSHTEKYREFQARFSLFSIFFLTEQCPFRHSSEDDY